MKRRLSNPRIPTGGDSADFREILIVDGKIAEISMPGESPNEEDAEMQQKVDKVKDAIHALLQKGVREREGVFR